MNSTGGRIAVAAAVVAVAVVAFLVLRPTAEDGGEDATTAVQETAGGSSDGGQGDDQGSKDEPRPKPQPAAIEIEVMDGAPVGGVEDIAVDRGDSVEMVVDSDAPEEIHVHGYEEFADVAPGKPARLDFEADIEGVFEVELEGSHVQIARLEVTP
jgi:hypothetical protein